MPTYLVHGFRWPRAAIRIHIILFDLEDASSDWIVAPASAITILNSFYTLYDFLPPSQPPIPNTISSASSNPDVPPLPNASNDILTGSAGTSSTSRKGGVGTRKDSEGGKKPPAFNDWSVVKLLEAYDPEDETCASQPYAYVADYITPILSSLDIAAEMAAYEDKQRVEAEPLLSPGAHTPGHTGKNGSTSSSMSEQDMRRKSRRLGWFEKLRDQLAKEASIGWYVVVCGDEERIVPDFASLSIKAGMNDKGSTDDIRPKKPRSAGLRNLFGKKNRRPTLSAEEEK
jgi:hypothetical protein